MKRRKLLASLCSAGAAWYAFRPPERVLDVRFWCTEQADAYRDVRTRVREYLGVALRDAHPAVRVTCGGTASVSGEDAYRAMIGGEWPAVVATGLVEDGPVSPADDVNLLVTDGSVTDTPSGAGVPHVAAVGGARHLSRLPPRADRPPVVDYTTRARVAQVLLHECGHALGLDHGHGAVRATGGGVVASPMISAYAWASPPVREQALDGDENECGESVAATDGGRRRLSLRYADCARAAIRGYRGGLAL